MFLQIFWPRLCGGRQHAGRLFVGEEYLLSHSSHWQSVEDITDSLTPTDLLKVFISLLQQPYWTCWLGTRRCLGLRLLLWAGISCSYTETHFTKQPRKPTFILKLLRCNNGTQIILTMTSTTVVVQPSQLTGRKRDDRTTYSSWLACFCSFTVRLWHVHWFLVFIITRTKELEMKRSFFPVKVSVSCRPPARRQFIACSNLARWSLASVYLKCFTIGFSYLDLV